MTATLDSNLLLAIPLAPLAGALLAGLFGKTIGRAGAHTVTIVGVAIAFVLSALTLSAVIGGAGYNATVYEWMRLGTLKFEIGFLIDSLSALMMCVVSFVSLMVHVYTIGYMRDDPGYQRFFSYISLFTFAMLMLVMSNNFLQLFFGWEAVGVVSYLLIGFLVHQANRNLCQYESVSGQSGRRFWFYSWDWLAICVCGLAQLWRCVCATRSARRIDFPGYSMGPLNRRLHLSFYRRDGQVRAISAACLAA